MSRGCCSVLLRGAERLFASSLFTHFTTILTIYALFGDDFRIAATKKDQDPYFDVIGAVCLAVFCLDVQKTKKNLRILPYQ